MGSGDKPHIARKRREGQVQAFDLSHLLYLLALPFTISTKACALLVHVTLLQYNSPTVRWTHAVQFVFCSCLRFLACNCTDAICCRNVLILFSITTRMSSTSTSTSTECTGSTVHDKTATPTKTEGVWLYSIGKVNSGSDAKCEVHCNPPPLYVVYKNSAEHSAERRAHTSGSYRRV